MSLKSVVRDLTANHDLDVQTVNITFSGGLSSCCGSLPYQFVWITQSNPGKIVFYASLFKRQSKACKAITNKLRGKTGRIRTQQLTPGASKHVWANEMLTKEPTALFPVAFPPWHNAPPTYHNKLTAAKAQQQKLLQQIKTEHLGIWTDS
ncbi:hypothetical protein MMC22_005411 [Lobaria immixta]|nr:hypothetical protein [Lobaria immixta]